MNELPLVTLTTDFGTTDGYVGTMKGVILNIVPAARLVDISHQIAPQGVRDAAYVLYTAFSYFPPHTVHVVVVDPGVGSGRRSIALQTAQGIFVGPDNGVFSYVIANTSMEKIVELVDADYHLLPVSQTFHGRDIFAPVAAHLASGVSLDALGPVVHDPVMFPVSSAVVKPQEICGEVLHIDRFGNVITNIGRLEWAGDDLLLDPVFGCKGTNEHQDIRIPSGEAVISVAGREIHQIRQIYASVTLGSPVALVGSAGHLEVAVREGCAAREMGACVGDPVIIEWRS